VLRRLTAAVAVIAFGVVLLFMSCPSGRVAITVKDPGRAAFLPTVTPVPPNRVRTAVPKRLRLAAIRIVVEKCRL
jgi:hypothetical protein